MATPNFSGKQWQAVVALHDVSVVPLGTNTTTDCMTASSNLYMYLDTVNPVNMDGMIQQSPAVRSGSRVLREEDMVQQYGYGECTWDFDYLVKNEVLMQNLLSLIIGKGIDSTADPIAISDAVTKDENLQHGLTGVTTDVVAQILLLAPTTPSDMTAFDVRMHSAVLQNLTISMDMGTDSGRMRMAGQFMSGYKPVIADSGLSGVSTATNFEKGIFDAATRTINGVACTMKSFSMTISNPATRVGHQGTSGETDGYVRGGEFEISGTCSVKLDEATHAFQALYQAGTAMPIVLGDGADFSITIPKARLTGFNNDMAAEGVFVEIPWKATVGTQAAAVNLASIVMS